MLYPINNHTVVSQILSAQADAAKAPKAAVMALDAGASASYSRADEWYEIDGWIGGCIGIGRTEASAWADALKTLTK